MTKKSLPTNVLLVRNNDKSAFGGGEIYQLMLAKELKRNGFNPILISSCRSLRVKAKSEGYELRSAWHIPFQNWSSWRLLFLPLYFLWQLILTLRYVYLFMVLRPSAANIQSRDDQVAATLAGRLTGVRILWTDHADFQSWVMQNVKVKFKSPIAKLILKLANRPERIIFVSNSDLEYFKALRPELHNLQLIKNGVVDGYARNKCKDKMDFCYVGRLDLAKGLKELIEAFLEVERVGYRTKLHLYGEGSARAELEELASDSSAVIFHGFTNEPLKAIAQSRIFVLPSYKEGLSLSLLEACMLGRSIIATKVGGTPDLITDKETGLLIPPMNVDALKEAMIYLLENPEMGQKMGRAARSKYLDGYDFQKIFSQQMLALYKK